MDDRTLALPLYEALANRIAALVDDGVLRAGMRAPSVRSFAAQHGVSLTTALQAYRLLEDRGVLEARPKSGFYVMVRPHQQRALPTVSQPLARHAGLGQQSRVQRAVLCWRSILCAARLCHSQRRPARG
ncbi:GntR family transcriptional regulator [Bradyrhizobium sp. HKCCYLS3077]|uniref:GntR family transcriptional regulator n=1 Tax=Bradyrhizobium sp. HKCCYLS3077 TaxID=3420761 RepID=UPI003EB7F727